MILFSTAIRIAPHILWILRAGREQVLRLHDASAAANGLAGRFNEAWEDALGRGKGWTKRAMEGRRALLIKRPELASKDLWGV